MGNECGAECKFGAAGMRMVQWMCCVSLRDRVPSAELGGENGD